MPTLKKTFRVQQTVTAEARKDESAVCKAMINHKHVNQKKGRMAKPLEIQSR